MLGVAESIFLGSGPPRCLCPWWWWLLPHTSPISYLSTMSLPASPSRILPSSDSDRSYILLSNPIRCFFHQINTNPHLHFGVFSIYSKVHRRRPPISKTYNTINLSFSSNKRQRVESPWIDVEVGMFHVLWNCNVEQRAWYWESGLPSPMSSKPPTAVTRWIHHSCSS